MRHPPQLSVKTCGGGGGSSRGSGGGQAGGGGGVQPGVGGGSGRGVRGVSSQGWGGGGIWVVVKVRVRVTELVEPVLVL